MAVSNYLLTTLSLLELVLSVGDQNDMALQDLLQQHEEQRKQEMTWLLEMEAQSQQLHDLTQDCKLFADCWTWWLWASAEALFVLIGLYWLRRQRSTKSDSDSQQDAPAAQKI